MFKGDTMSYETILVETQGRVGIITLNRPKALNALCNALPLSSPEKQGLLEADGIAARFERLNEVLRFSLASGEGRRLPNSGTFH